ncbi:hypothetical protein A3H75_02220 [Candidatus Uhrbacteria bacterium RIFCSPLOWO2_02_FULL_51_9]|uniref:Uncharacterized protein n=1 Tax=Candidatus Uhrbacteria bacterium RIFCSPLOWO2_02_FULL_51_9 TaxID=1802410 RepID=A0A1F7VG00_9BACT|nr:MAG: hypothetical protein A3H75_02220 [Candidatus Uhrbacteria bacterium RIFCSPLOWO2_02_FULL_51_9]
MTEKPRGEMPEAQRENKPLDAAKAIVEATEKHIADQKDLSDRERKLVIEAIHNAKFVVVDAIKDMLHDKEGWDDVNRVRDLLNYGWEKNED